MAHQDSAYLSAIKQKFIKKLMPFVLKRDLKLKCCVRQ